MDPIISEGRLRGQFYGNYWDRGRSYRADVLNLECAQSEERVSLKARVRGSSYTPYTCTIDCVRSPLRLIGTCSCPVGYNCKHIAAVAMVALSKGCFEPPKSPREIAQKKIDQWFGALATALPATPQESAEGAQFFYALHLSATGTIKLELMTRKILKKGGFGKEYSFNIDRHRHNYHTLEGVGAADREIIGLCLKLQPAYYASNPIDLEGMYGAIVLRKALESGKCYLKKELQTPLRLAATRTFNLGWRKWGGELKLEFTCKEAKGAQLLLLEPYMYLDAKSFEVGEVSGVDFTPSVVRSLLAMPKIAQEDAAYLTKKLLIEYPYLNLPLPKSDYVHTLEHIAPRFILELSGRHARLHVRYGDYEAQIAKALRRETLEAGEAQMVVLERNLEAEAEAIALLQERFALSPQHFGDERSILFAPPQGTQAALYAWHRFLEGGVSELRTLGWEVREGEEPMMDFSAAESVDAAIEDQNGWFDLRFDLHVEGERFGAATLLAPILREYDTLEAMPELLYLPLDAQRCITVSKALVAPLIETLCALFDTYGEHDAYKLHAYDAPLLQKMGRSGLAFSGDSRLQEIAQKLEHFEGIVEVQPPQGLKADLRDYQRKGLAWLQFLREYGFGGILADDMGLGKTVQTLAYLLLEQEALRLEKPVLIVAPTSLMSNWRREAERFAPSLKVLTLQGDARKERFDAIAHHQIILSTYPLIVRDFEMLSAHEYSYLILDEAQHIKNHRSKAAQHLRAIRADAKLCLTGTPMENHLGELWGIFDFLMEGFLFEEKFFNEQFRTPIEKLQDASKRTLLHERTRAFMLRRRKNDVVRELPSKTEMIRSVPLGKEQAALYESIRISMDKQVRDAIAAKGFARSQIMILDALLKLRQVCCDPSLLKIESAKKIKESAKLEMLLELVEELLEEGRRILLFSQFTSMLSIIEERLERAKISYVKLTGATKKREEVIDAFKNGNVDLFLISLKA
ncbi:MAG: DEAD/DEAH box helicase family protein, partial [Campylobacterales bacterium]|nr:DEAD/DEAH box helicase family protein [Campylobacterales bacterium]